MKTFEDLLADEEKTDPGFLADWQRTAPARAFAAALLGYRAEHGLSQRGLAKRLEVSQPRIVKLESGEHNPDLATIIKVVKRLGIEFSVDVAPANGRKPRPSKRAQKQPKSHEATIEHDDVSVVVTASAG